MERFCQELHPVYGAVPRDGDFVVRGDILGLSVDTQEVVTAPFSGWVRLVSTNSTAERQLCIEIAPAAEAHDAPPSAA